MILGKQDDATITHKFFETYQWDLPDRHPIMALSEDYSLPFSMPTSFPMRLYVFGECLWGGVVTTSWEICE